MAFRRRFSLPLPVAISTASINSRPRNSNQQATQERRDLNPQPPVLETGALPIELRSFRRSQSIASRYFRLILCKVRLRSRGEYFFSWNFGTPP